MAVLLLIGLMLGLSLVGLPLVFSILAASALTMLVYRPDLPIELVAQLFVNGMDQSVLLAIVFFFLTGELMNRGGITRRIIDFANALVGSIRGGLGHVNVVTSLFFSGITGSAVADTAAVGSVMIPSMAEKGFSRGFAAAITQTSAVIGPIIPPSIPAIIYAVLAEQSVGAMFLAGILPGVLVGLCLMVAVYFISRHRDYPRERRLPVLQTVRRGVVAGAALLAPVIIVGGIVTGAFTATEAGSVAALYSFVLGKFVYGELGWREVGGALIRSAQGAATVLVILGSSSVFAWIVADLKVSEQVAAFIFAASENPLIVLLLINLFVLVLGLFMDPLAALIIIVPVLLPIAVEAGVDPIQFGIMIILNLMIGLCTPPVGYLIYLSAQIAEVKPETVIRESLPFFAALLVALAACIYVPALTLTLPGLFS